MIIINIFTALIYVVSSFMIGWVQYKARRYGKVKQKNYWVILNVLTFIAISSWYGNNLITFIAVACSLWFLYPVCSIQYTKNYNRIFSTHWGLYNTMKNSMFVTLVILEIFNLIFS